MDYAYLTLLRKIMEYGEERGDRTGTGTLSLFGERMVFNLSDGYPLLTTKKMPFKTILRELLWFISGSTNVKELHPCKIWDQWADANGDLGPVYGAQWRPQLDAVIQRLIDNPECRRHIVSSWNVAEIKDMALPPCHLLFQFYVSEGKNLDIQVYQRSCDMFLGVPFNIASYAALVHMVAKVTDLEPGVLTWVGGDCHVYLNHVDQVDEQLLRIPSAPPILKVHGPKDIHCWGLSDFELIGYNPHPAINGDVSV